MQTTTTESVKLYRVNDGSDQQGSEQNYYATSTVNAAQQYMATYDTNRNEDDSERRITVHVMKAYEFIEPPGTIIYGDHDFILTPHGWVLDDEPEHTYALNGNTARRKVASSHEGQFSYWQDADRYIYQLNENTGKWNGWFCSLEAWERTFSHSAWMTLEVAA